MDLLRRIARMGYRVARRLRRIRPCRPARRRRAIGAVIVPSELPPSTCGRPSKRAPAGAGPRAQLAGAGRDPTPAGACARPASSSTSDPIDPHAALQVNRALAGPADRRAPPHVRAPADWPVMIRTARAGRKGASTRSRPRAFVAIDQPSIARRGGARSRAAGRRPPRRGGPRRDDRRAGEPRPAEPALRDGVQFDQLSAAASVAPRLRPGPLPVAGSVEEARGGGRC
jgi:hypothetical protein